MTQTIITSIRWTGKTMAGAKKWAAKTLSE